MHLRAHHFCARRLATLPHDNSKPSEACSCTNETQHVMEITVTRIVDFIRRDPTVLHQAWTEKHQNDNDTTITLSSKTQMKEQNDYWFA
ncbi:hypothetical protein Pmar_PMAR029625 [Perkinsus marinus ATCC 50983]|uniref:Uncharacterized protein n=1 Tax=Perkinsus marinus (strain ATCC 50983 / TXsc) TaxID=423536 RepID=C5KX00_PERM5|nr:hypothetical protein Pmar_PMAR029625 [Perkinsus marinus ATCC 50983]EER11004.1 hypothetical protein Pmar_PMAR029625 [Perkinsus marinus ATCC 50983]|eukprot:XP_002779209.1 hypothetical protein Pmar_PMAR029625 [Perkinsus marinus ATCC 50983]